MLISLLHLLKLYLIVHKNLGRLANIAIVLSILNNVGFRDWWHLARWIWISYGFGVALTRRWFSINWIDWIGYCGRSNQRLSASFPITAVASSHLIRPFTTIVWWRIVNGSRNARLNEKWFNYQCQILINYFQFVKRTSSLVTPFWWHWYNEWGLAGLM